MTVVITDNLTEIDAVDAANEAGWTPTSSSDFAGFQRAGNLCYGDQGSEGIFNQFFTDSAVADYGNRTIFGWMRSGNPNTEANDGFGIILGDLRRELTSVTINTVGAGYSTSDVLTIVGGTFVTVATVNVTGASTITAQNHTNYDGAGGNGTFVGGTIYVVNDVNTMSDGSTITVDAVSGGVITQFTVTTNSSSAFTDGATLTQSSTTSALGTGFTMSPGFPNQELETVSVANAGVYGIDPSSPNTPTGGTGTGAILNLTMSDGAVNARTSYTVGGGDNYGNFVIGWSGFRLDTASLPTNFIDIVGTAPPLVNRIIDIGYAIDYQTKALGNADNIFWDRLTFIANGAPAVRIAGGTTGARGTFAEIVIEDLNTANAYGIIRELVGSKAYEVFFGIEIGNTTGTDSFFDDSDFQLFLNGNGSGDGGMTAGNMNIDFLGGTATNNLINFNTFFVQSVGTTSNWDMSDTDISELIWTDGQFVDMGTFLFQAQDAGSKTLTNLIWTNCGQVTFVGIDADGCTFNGTTNALGAILWNATSVEENQDNLTFNSDGTGHAIEISLNTASLTTFNIDGYTVTGYEAAEDTGTGNTVFLVDNDLDGDVDINVVDGSGNFAYEKAAGYTGNVQIISSVTLSLTGIETDSEVRIINLDDTINFSREIDGDDQIEGGTQSAIIANGGSSYTNGTQTLTIVGGTGTATQIEVEVVANVVDSINSITVAGSYTVNPPTPATTTGGGGTGATFRLDISGQHDFVYSSSGLGGTQVAIIVFHLNFKEVRIEQPLATESQSIPIQQNVDRTYNNP